jgi:cytochrome b561
VSARDIGNGYGWISITLHWLAAAVVLTMLTVGSLSQGSAEGPADPRMVHLHTTIGVTAYALLWGRVVWRFVVGHPGPLPRQGKVLFSVGKYFHYVMLFAIGTMLVSGPLIAWSAGQSIGVFTAGIPSPMAESPELHRLARSIHGYAATFILAGMLLHVAAVFKHTIINRDGTFDKIMIAGAGRQD